LVRKRVAILLSGSGSNMVALVRAMQARGFAEPVLVAANRADAGGLQKAADLGLATACVPSKPYGGDRAAFEAALAPVLEAARPDIIAQAGFMRILTPGFVDRFAGRMLNIHPSLLPKYKGLNTHARALEAGDSESGCSVHLVTPELDGGPVLGQARVPILPGDTPERLAARVLEQEHILYPAVLERFVAGETTPLYLE
jgi:phosphoribosylglycinamide formyltransferase-1